MSVNGSACVARTLQTRIEALGSWEADCFVRLAVAVPAAFPENVGAGVVWVRSNRGLKRAPHVLKYSVGLAHFHCQWDVHVLTIVMI